MKQPLAVGYTRAQAPGAWPNGSTVRKINSLPGDGNPDGTLGHIVGSIDLSDHPGGNARFGYFVAWSTRPTIPVFVADVSAAGKPRLELAPCP